MNKEEQERIGTVLIKITFSRRRLKEDQLLPVTSHF